MVQQIKEYKDYCSKQAELVLQSMVTRFPESPQLDNSTE